jgi:hypothetical protein
VGGWVIVEAAGCSREPARPGWRPGWRVGKQADRGRPATHTLNPGSCSLSQAAVLTDGIFTLGQVHTEGLAVCDIAVLPLRGDIGGTGCWAPWQLACWEFFGISLKGEKNRLPYARAHAPERARVQPLTAPNKRQR